MSGKTRKINKNLYYWKGNNFGDELNRYLFEKVFGIQFNYCTDVWSADYVAIGSVLGWSCSKPVSLKDKVNYAHKLLTRKIKRSKLTVLGSGFLDWSENHKVRYLRKMDYKIVRGKLTEKYLRENSLLKGSVLLGDLGLLCPYMISEENKKYRLGIIPHYNDLNSPAVYDMYKKYGKDCIMINVQDEAETVIKQITECENIVASSLHGLIIADSYCIPNLWFENTLKYRARESRESGRFKYRDYYSIYGINEIEPVGVLELNEIALGRISEMYKVTQGAVTEKQEELYNYCKAYFEEAATR